MDYKSGPGGGGAPPSGGFFSGLWRGLFGTSQPSYRTETGAVPVAGAPRSWLGAPTPPYKTAPVDDAEPCPEVGKPCGCDEPCDCAEQPDGELSKADGEPPPGTTEIRIW